MTLVLLVLGLVAGVLTTLAGQGGGLLLLVACSNLVGPHAALAITAPALLFGNLHRAVLFRRDIDRGVAARMIAGAAPGAVLGGLLVGVLQPWMVSALLVVLAALAIARAAGVLAFSVPRGALAPAAFVVGGMTGTSGGAGVLFAPILLSAGLGGRAFVGTVSSIALATHVGRVASYGAAGLFPRELLAPTVVVAAAIFLGNALGERVRRAVGPASGGAREAALRKLEYGALVVAAALSVAGLR